MKRIVYSVLIAILLISCEEKIIINQKYSDFQTDLTDLQKRNLYGNIKECTLYSTDFNFEGTKKTEKPRLINKEVFNESGSIQRFETYDLDGKINHSEVYFYDKNNDLIKKINNVESFVSIELFKKDSENRNENFIEDDTLRTEHIKTYDKFNNLIKHTIIQNQNNFVKNYNYTFDSKNNIIRYESENTSNGNENIMKYKYDENGNIIEKIYGSGKSLRKRISEYKDNILTKITEFKILKDSTETLAYITKYDKNYNDISINVYKDEKLYRETKNEYVFDKYGNWIEKKCFDKRNYRNSNKFQLTNINTRKITYWE